MASGSCPDRACFSPANCASSTSRRSISRDRLVRRAGLRRVPVVVGQRPHRAGDVVREGGELHLGQPGRVVVLRRQGIPLGGQRLVERGPHLVEGAAEVAAPARRVAHPADPLGQLVQTSAAVDATAQQVAQRLARAPCRPARRGRPRRGRRARRTAAPAGRGRRARGRSGTGRGWGRVGSASMRRTRCAPPPCPCRCGGSGAGPRGRTRPRRRPLPGEASSPWPSRSSTLDSPGTVPIWASRSAAEHQLAGLHDGALGEQVGETGQVEPGQAVAEGLRDGDPQQVLEHLALSALLAHLELDLAQQGRHDSRNVADACHGLRL